jgi:hypothetical protein
VPAQMEVGRLHWVARVVRLRSEGQRSRSEVWLVQPQVATHLRMLAPQLQQVLAAQRGRQAARVSLAQRIPQVPRAKPAMVR